jgi:hypothetical protein
MDTSFKESRLYVSRLENKRDFREEAVGVVLLLDGREAVRLEPQ